MTQRPRLEAVLFDMDGTLVDSEKVWQGALADLADHYGGVLSPAARHALIGATTGESMEIFFRALGQPDQDHDAAGAWLEARVMAIGSAGVVWRPGARELLLAARAAGVKTALATATGRPITEAMLDTIGRGNFDVTITDDDVANGKPHPDPYRTAAAKLGVETGNCVAIEDSPTGAASAVAAGCSVLAVPSEVDLSDLAGVTIARSLEDVDLAFLESLVVGRAGGA